MNTNDPRFELIRRHRDGEATPEESTLLESHLRNDKAYREAYVRYLNLDLALSSGVAPSSCQPVITPKTNRWIQWRPLAAAAAGLVFGMFSASMVWAYAVPMVRTAGQRTVAIFAESFEHTKAPPRNGFPNKANEWTGHFSLSIGEEDEVSPKSGLRMVRLSQLADRRLAYAWRILDLTEMEPATAGESRQLEVTASFHASDAVHPQRYQIRLAAFREAPDEVRPIWNDADTLFDNLLQHVARTLNADPGADGWQTVHATLDLPPGSRSLVISLAAGVADAANPATANYLDDVHASFIVKQAQPLLP